MFTGIISQMGCVTRLTRVSGGARLAVQPARPLTDLAGGESIAVNGVCLTAEPDSMPTELRFFLSDETLRRSALGALTPDERVNLERSLRADDRLGGHLVMGHVDGVGTLRSLEPVGEGWRLEFEYPPELGPFLAPKGSVAVDGISLTVVDLRDAAFSVAVIPHTHGTTNLHRARPGRRVNLEADVMARYVARALEALGASAGGVTRDLLARAGFVNVPRS